MNTKRFSKLLAVLFVSLSTVFIASCDKDDDVSEPNDTVTLNMLSEDNGKTILGNSDVYISKSNNFRTISSRIADVGSASGVGVRVAPKLTNLVQEAAVVKGHVYQVFDKFSVFTFPSGVNAVPVDEAYYQVYVVAPITEDKKTTGAVIKYISRYPDAKGLPENGRNLGNLRSTGEVVEMALPKGAECLLREHSGETGKNVFEVSTDNGKLRIMLTEYPDHQQGPYGDYTVYIRVGSIYSSVAFTVGL